MNFIGNLNTATFLHSKSREVGRWAISNHLWTMSTLFIRSKLQQYPIQNRNSALTTNLWKIHHLNLQEEYLKKSKTFQSDTQNKETNERQQKYMEAKRHKNSFNINKQITIKHTFDKIVTITKSCIQFTYGWNHNVLRIQYAL